MAQLLINVGAAPNDGTGDRPYTAGVKINSNFTELYAWARERVTANRTYYVATTGNDSHTGLSIGVALLTIQKAIEIIVNTLSIDEGVVITIAVSNGTYTISTAVLLDPYVGPGTVQIVGNTGTPGSAIITSSAATELFLSTDRSKPYYVAGFRLQASGGTPVGFLANGGTIQFGNIEFNTGLDTHLRAKNGGVIQALANYTIIGAAVNHMEANTQACVNVDAVTVTLSSTPAFNGFTVARTLGYVSADGTTYAGSATGKRYFAETNAVINTDGGGSTFFPGSVSGSTTTGGQYV